MAVQTDTLSPPRTRTALLVGNPNTGKTTVFNKLTGYRQRVGNYPGVTVDRKSGRLRNASIDMVDLPGAYSLAATSADEAVVLDTLLGGQLDDSPAAADSSDPDVIVCVVDASHLHRNLFLLSQVCELGLPVVVALTMVDVAENAGLSVDVEKLAALLGIPVIPTIAHKGTGIDALREGIKDSIGHPACRPRVRYPAVFEEALQAVDKAARQASIVDSSLKTLSEDGRRVMITQALLHPGGVHESSAVARYGLGFAETLEAQRRQLRAVDLDLYQLEGAARYAWIQEIEADVVSRGLPKRPARGDAVDRVLTHPVYGMVIFLVLMAIVFQSIYRWAEPLMGFVEWMFAGLSTLAASAIPPGAFQSLVTDGIIAGVGGVLVFLPQIMFLFLFIAILEDCGYMSRAAFLAHRFLSPLGLSGKAFVPLLSSFACAVPGIMATRTMEQPRDRLITVLIAPLMSCSARLPVYTLLIGVFIPSSAILGGVMNLQGVTLLAMYLVGLVVAIPMALILKRMLASGPSQPFLIELPGYHWPSIGTVLYRVYEQAREFCVQAGTIIFAVTIVVWALGYYPHPASIAKSYAQQRATVESQVGEKLDAVAQKHVIKNASSGAELVKLPAVVALLDQATELDARWSAASEAQGLEEGSPAWAQAAADHEKKLATMFATAGDAGQAAAEVYEAHAQGEALVSDIDREEQGAYLRQSILGRIGLLIEPAVKPLGWDWRIGTAVVASFPAREVVIATLATIHNLGSEADETSRGLRDKLKASTWPDGRKVFNVPVALSVMVFFALCCQCGATLAAIKRETKSWRWPIFTFAYMTGLAYVCAFLTYHVASWLA